MRICWWSCHLQASSWPKSFPSIQPTWTSTTCSPWTPSCTSECLRLCVCVCVSQCVCVCVPVLHEHGLHHIQVNVCAYVCVTVLHQPGHPLSPVHGLPSCTSECVCVCVSQYSTNLDIHHLQSMAPSFTCECLCVSLCVCVSQYSTNLDIHHLQSMAPLHARVCPVCLLLPKLHQPGHPHPPVHGNIICKCLSTCLSILSACPKTAPTWTSMSSSSLNLMSKM